MRSRDDIEHRRIVGPVSAVPAYYDAPIARFVREQPETVLGSLAQRHGFVLEAEQRDAWLDQCEIMRRALDGLAGKVFLEFDVPRLGSRIDAVVLLGGAVFPIEFKCGDTEYRRAAIEQAWDYALDLKNFHAASHDALLFPILVATEAQDGDTEWAPAHADGVRPPFKCNRAGLRYAVELGARLAPGPKIDPDVWGEAPYSPTPTIVEAARALYKRHSVAAIARNDAGARNLRVTSGRIEDIIDTSRREGRKSLVLVTGVPGAGKTLVGLNIATRRRDERSTTHAVYLSGNHPLVAVLQEALTRDEMERQRREGRRSRKGEIRQRVKPFIQNVHHFRDEGWRFPSRPPADRVVIFDEAQRAWTREKSADFMKRRKGVANFSYSEPEFLLSYMDRHEDWAVLVGLVGGGQEIHTGEAGIGAWIAAAREKFSHWSLHVSPELRGAEYAAPELEELAREPGAVMWEPALHLDVSMRSFRSERVSEFVKALLDLDRRAARELIARLRRYPVAVTRDLAAAKRWVREHARGSERYGLVASSQAMRLKPYAVDVRVSVNPVHWFLNPAEDTRSSYYLEDAATEFQVQGLELDWACVTWDADVRLSDTTWRFHEFRADRWIHVHKPDRRRYMLNTYRVLLTRARQGMVIFVPPGDPEDPTRSPEYYAETYDYLASLGLQQIGS